MYRVSVGRYVTGRPSATLPPVLLTEYDRERHLRMWEKTWLFAHRYGTGPVKVWENNDAYTDEALQAVRRGDHDQEIRDLIVNLPIVNLPMMTSRTGWAVNETSSRPTRGRFKIEPVPFTFPRWEFPSCQPPADR